MRLLRLSLLFCASTTGIACGPDHPVELDAPAITLVIGTDMAVPSEIDRVVFDTSPGSTTIEELTTLPAALTFTCDGVFSYHSCGNAFEVAITGKLGPLQERVSAAAAMTFLDYRHVVLPLSLCRACSGVTCLASQTCIAGSCVSRTVVEPHSLPDLDEDLEVAHCTEVASTSCTPNENCPTTAMVSLGGFSIDAHEVTQAQYQAFLASYPAASIQDPNVCATNTSFLPDDNFCFGCADGEDCSQYPQNCIDWCDARAFCTWAGKRLCGAVAGGPNPHDQHNMSSSQWFSACSANGTSAFPYGASYQPQICNDEAAGLSSPINVQSATTCETTTPRGIFDLSGNVSEWEDSCDGTSCRVRGGSFSSSEADLRCDASDSRTPDYQDARIGFRCCSN